MKQKRDVLHSAKLLKYILIGLIVFLGLVCLYNGSVVAPGLSRGFETFDDGSDPVTGRGDDVEEWIHNMEHSLELPKRIPV